MALSSAQCGAVVNGADVGAHTAVVTTFGQELFECVVNAAPRLQCRGVCQRWCTTQRQDERAAQQALAQATRQVEDAAREVNRLTTQEQVDHERHERLREAMSTATIAKDEAETRLRDRDDAADTRRRPQRFERTRDQRPSADR